ncbi:hypothetical protein HBI56_124290 [Parastagonospora nodorum]|nr:hypothetical protein HBH53_103480 [Parastagonospora nodorum]KAH3968867.1 hypothetical protein HBH51_127380 [Parastagonospora nodorum]KAH3989255.1 hypothetical protein HBH52_014540 [Parastagonospora nodorum]KAH3997145.1 hypothetical protein HBI10_148110 [Parastagonospora nodorum]KAH4020028.1 hypothetical protein HBI13_121260 [Parastagonospora nodorum]
MTERQSTTTTAASEDIDRDVISQRHQCDSSLLHLPAELRNHIWDCIFSGITFHVSDPDQRIYDPIKLFYVERYIGTLTPGLVYVCRQIYGETSFHLLRRSTFRMMSVCAFMKFLGLLSNQQRNAIEVINTHTGALQGLFGNGPPREIYNNLPDFWTWVTDGAWSVDMSLLKFALFEKLGGLRRLELQIWGCTDLKPIRVARRIVRMALKQLGAPDGIRLRLQVERLNWQSPNRRSRS